MSTWPEDRSLDAAGASPSAQALPEGSGSVPLDGETVSAGRSTRLSAGARTGLVLGWAIAIAALVAVLLLCIGLISFIAYAFMDKKLENQMGESGEEKDDPFKVSDLGRIFSSKVFWIVALLCVLYYSAIFPFQKYAINMLQCNLKYTAEQAGLVFFVFPLGAAAITPFLGNFLDRKGKGATMLILGAVLMICCHLTFAFILPATQSPLMARCLGSERQARPVFYGAMISESIIALIWAAVAMAFWNGVGGLNAAIAEYGGQAAVMVDAIARDTLGEVLAQMQIDTDDVDLMMVPVLNGGPVHPERGFVIHDDERDWDSSLRVGENRALRKTQQRWINSLNKTPYVKTSTNNNATSPVALLFVRPALIL